MLFEQEIENDRTPRHIYELEEEDSPSPSSSPSSAKITYVGESPPNTNDLLVFITRSHNHSLIPPYPFPTTPLGTFSLSSPSLSSSSSNANSDSSSPIGVLSNLTSTNTSLLITHTLAPVHLASYASLILSTFSSSSSKGKKIIIIDFSQPPTSLSDKIESIPGTLQPPTLIVGLSAALLLSSSSSSSSSSSAQILIPPRSSSERLPEIWNMAFKALDIKITIPHPDWIPDSVSSSSIPTLTRSTSAPVLDSMYI